MPRKESELCIVFWRHNIHTKAKRSMFKEPTFRNLVLFSFTYITINNNFCSCYINKIAFFWSELLFCIISFSLYIEQTTTCVGFAAYCGFIHLEASHTNPVLIMFLRLLIFEKQKIDSNITAIRDPETAG